MEGRTTQIDGLFDFTVNPAAETLKTALRSLFDYVPFRLLTAPGLYGWLALFALASVMGCRRRWNAIVTLPSLMTLAGCLFSAVNGYFRYAVPLYFAAPLLLALLSQALFSGRRGGRAKKPAA
jgi:CHASE2 domain-containing sensor protein